MYGKVCEEVGAEQVLYELRDAALLQLEDHVQNGFKGAIVENDYKKSTQDLVKIFRI